MDLEAYLDVEEREKRNIQKSTLILLVRSIFKHPWVLCGGLVMIFLGTSAALLEPRLFGYAIDDAIVPKRWDMLRWVSISFVFVTCIRTVAAIQQSYLFELLGQRVTQDLRIRLFSHLQRMPISVYDKNPAGRLLTRVTNDVASLNEMFSAGFVSMFCNFLQVVGILVWILTMDWKLGLVSICLFPLLIAASVYFSGRLRKAYRDSRGRLSALNGFLAENLAGMKIVHLFNRQKLHAGRFDRLNQWYADAQTASIRVFALFQPTITVAAGASIALVIWYGGYQAWLGEIKLGILVAYFSYVLSLFQPIREIADKWNTFLSGMASAERIFAILDWPTEIEQALIESPAEPLSVRGHLVFENVWFAYSGENWILKDFCMEIKPGERVGVVGHTGAGKTTLISLLMRFYEPQKGRILLDGKDLRQYDKRALRASIGIVQQDVFLFSGSFEENLTFWKKIDSEKVQKTLQSLGFKKDFQECLQERGSNLSMGERQVIAFARAILAEPRIWILDEATSNMDSDTERHLQKSLDSASAQKTTILIAHRLATVKSADRILVLNKGALVESGSHETLVSQNGLYARLYRYQASQEASV